MLCDNVVEVQPLSDVHCVIARQESVESLSRVEWRDVNQSIDQSINFINERVKTTDIVTKINTNYDTIKQIQ